MPTGETTLRATMKAAAIAAAAFLTTAGAAAGPPSTRVQKVDDGYLMGNPAAPLKIVVVSSFGCPHCRVLDINMMDPLKRNWIDTGKASLRFVPYVLFTPDIPTIIAADCGSPTGFFARASALFSIQRSVTQAYYVSKQASSQTRPDDFSAQNVKAIADATGIVQKASAAGVGPAAAARCIADPQARKTLAMRQTLAKKRYGVEGTPDVTLNGRDLKTGGSWPGLESALKVAARG